jgi:exopolysaccharide biosynthesis polyprenyl glycosylphosphotransferase
MNKRFQLIKYITSDFLSAALSWSCFYIYRKIYVEPLKYEDVPITFDSKFFLGIIVIPLFWVMLYYASGYYREVIRKSRLAELWYTLRITFLGVIILFFSLILDDTINSYANYYTSFLTLFGLHFICTYFPRLIITTRTTLKIHRGILGWNTLIIGGNQQAVEVYHEIKGQSKSSGNILIGFISVNDCESYAIQEYLPQLGTIDNLKEVIDKHEVEEVIIAIEYSERDKIERILYKLIDSNVIIKTLPSMYDIFTGKVSMSTIFGTPLMEISHHLVPAWQEYLKYFLDISLSVIALIILSPLCLGLIIGVKLSSKGPIFYSHERIGKNGKPFTIYKFRSMYVGSEKNGPELSSKEDNRVTPFGRFMRRSRLDEIPNFYNVLRGDMSLVGPRPERKHFIDKIVERAPHYIHLLKVKPGITSWGQVKYGYAENVDQMIRRMKYDLLYIENMSLYVDFKIMIYTIITIIKGKGI